PPPSDPNAPHNAPQGMPPTMAMPMMSPVPDSSFGVGATSGQQPNATTNMAWVGGGATPDAEFAPPKKSRAGLMIAVAAVTVLAAGGVALKLFSGSDTSAPAPTPHAAVQP